ncbi:MAG: PAS domain S-box protein [Desulfosarcina sp.]|nr:PAS domain S-box protein [Desulfosarcina sp.]MBC2743384.1 PAS domain S-box protein [Desulfosarcina sp.]MBC2766294.1 PAS domain S-box protein [Desulfosarcina sp.]
MTRDDHQTDHVPSEQLRYKIEELTHRNTELENFNNALTSERELLKKNLTDCSRLLKASTTGLISLDKSGLIDGVNTRAVDMLGADKSYLLKKPISLFIAPEDQAVFYINRSRIFAGARKQPFEIKLKTKDGAIWSARVNAQPVEMPEQHLPGMLLAVEDITPYRQALEALQLKEYFVNLLFSIIDDLSVWSTADIDEIIIYSLEKVGLVSGADRVYVCLFHDRKTRLSITHEWLSDGIESPAPALKGAPVDAFSSMLGQVKKRSTVTVSNINTLAPVDRAAHDEFHAPGVKSFLFATLFYGRYLLGIIGCDAVKQPVAWSRETQSLIQCVGGTIVNALLRRQVEKAPAKIRETILQFVVPGLQTGSDNLQEYEGPIEIINNDTSAAGEEKAHWRFEEGEPDDPDLLSTALLKDGKTANIACKHCNSQKLLDISEIRTIGTRLKATCACGNEMYIKIELRREHRKIVNLDGVFIRGRGDRIAMKSDDWGRILVNNISRHGIGFKVFGKQDVRVDDRFRVKFTLDNTASSVIQKEVVVRSVAQETIGCQFASQDACDVTIGFYMMT